MGEFYLSSRGKPLTECKVCAKARSRVSALADPARTKANQARYHERHPEKAAEFARTWQAKPESKVKIKAARSVWRKTNPDKRRASEARQRAAHPARYVRKRAAYYARNCELLKAKVAARVKLNPEKKRASDARYYREHPEKFKYGSNSWQNKYPERHAAKQGARRAAKLQATPVWANKFFMEEIYDLAARRAKSRTGGFAKWHVDHVVPLKGKTVCGLHVEHNLRVIPEIDNRKKGNRYWPGMSQSHDQHT